jgi:hypothetical protein
MHKRVGPYLRINLIWDRVRTRIGVRRKRKHRNLKLTDSSVLFKMTLDSDVYRRTFLWFFHSAKCRYCSYQQCCLKAGVQRRNLEMPRKLLLLCRMHVLKRALRYLKDFVSVFCSCFGQFIHGDSFKLCNFFCYEG